MNEHIICDLDGTIALDTGRALECLHSGKRDWDAYYARCHEDVPNHKLIDVLQRLSEGCSIWILSGRREDTREVTKKWLHDYEVPYDGLTMRPTGNFVDDHLLKPQWAEEMMLTPDRVLCIFEDRQRMVDRWRQLGYSCFQVAPGNF